MKVGSLVECINDSGAQYQMIKVKLNKIYTIREIIEVGSIINDRATIAVPSVLLEEIVNKNWNDSNVELSYKMERFREIIPPIANIEERINQNTLEPELVFRCAGHTKLFTRQIQVN